MLREILSITGRPGLYRLISQGKNSLIVEDLVSKNRFPAMGRDKIVSLGDIAMYTDSEDLPLSKILDRAYAAHEGKKVDLKGLIASNGLREAFKAIVPDFDEDRVYNSDIKKFFQWYNLLVDAGFTKFEEEEETSEEEKPEEEKEDAAE